MIPKRVTLENFLSFGRKTEISFDDDEPLWVLGGPNGVGKSAIFDAITYCLFGEHRGGSRDADKLVRHGANGFSVSFEFEFQGIDYRIARSRTKNKPVNSVERCNAGRWERVAGVNSVSEVNQWAQKTIGLGCEAFQASVLLRQGKSDMIIEATPSQRLEILKKIIGAERYEELSDRVSESRRAKVNELELWKNKRNLLKEITPEVVAAAKIALREAQQNLEAADKEARAQFERLAQAKRWAELEPRRKTLVDKIEAGHERAKDAPAIRERFARLKELREVLPLARQFQQIQSDLAERRPRMSELSRQCQETQSRRDDANARLNELRNRMATDQETVQRTAREARLIRDQMARTEKFRQSAEEVAKLSEQLAAFAESLDSDLAAANELYSQAALNERTAREQKASLMGLLDAAKNHRQRIETMESGVPCSACGQEVTAEHAARERAAARARVEALSDQIRAVDAQLQVATDALVRAEATRQQRQRDIETRNQLRVRLSDKSRDLEALGGTADIEHLKAQLAELHQQAEALVQAGSDAELRLASAKIEENRLVRDLQGFEKDFAKLANTLAEFERTTTSLQSRVDLLREQLPERWRGHVNLAEREAEARSLADAGIEEQFEQLQQDATRMQEWQRQLAECEAQLAKVPEEDRIPEDVAKAQQAAKQRQVDAAKNAHQLARDELRDLQRQAAEFTEVCRKLADAETTARIHTRLDELLGKANLQRELVRDAERQIVRLADDTVRQLSDGDLSLELDDSIKNDREALAIAVRRSDSANAIPVDYLSGSQKFRVAVAIALAMGRFAAGQARPLESVIIDEGFGSLDKDGLRASAEELNRLRQHLRKIILVSHQEDFVSAFPVGWQLAKGDDGTTATRFRR